MRIQIFDGVAIRYPWSGRGYVRVEKYDADGVLVKRASNQRVLNVAECEAALQDARVTAAKLAGEDNFVEIGEVSPKVLVVPGEHGH